MSKLKLALAVISVAAGFSAQAAPIVYAGADNAVTSLSQMVNSQAAAASFDTAVAVTNTITFETALPSSVNISGGSITNNSGCGALCGFATSGSNFYLTYSSATTFTFATAIDAFGMYITGLQTDLVGQETIKFSDGSSQTINLLAATGGGGEFIGFSDFGKSITSVTFDACGSIACDIVALDDVQYQTTTAVPEPATLSLVGLCLAGIGFARRRKAN